MLTVPFGEAIALGPKARPPRRGGGRTVAGDIFTTHLGLIGELEPDDVAALHGIEAEIRTVARGEACCAFANGTPRK